MVYERREEPSEPQIHRHAISHLPTGMDPVFPVNSATGDPANGEVLVFINGTWTTQNIQTVVNNYTTTTGGGLGVRYIPFGSDLSAGQSVAL